jgi:PKD domain
MGGSRIATDTSGNVYACDPYSGFVRKYTGTGTFLGTVGPQTAGLIGVAGSPDGGVYIAYTSPPTPGYIITRYDSAGTAVETIPVDQATQISAFGADGDGNLYILDTSSSRVERFQASDSSWTQWGSSGDGNGQFDFFQGTGTLAVGTDGTVYVSDRTNRIQKFTPTGDFLTAWGSTGSGLGQFGTIGSLAVDSAGHVYAADVSPRWIGNSVVAGPMMQEFDSSGNYLGSANLSVFALTTYGNDLVYGVFGNSVYRLELTIPSVSFYLSPAGQSSLYVSQPLTATATASVPFGSITGYSFDFGAGGPVVTGSSATATSSYMIAGTYRVTVKATSSRGGSAAASVAIVVNPRSPVNASPPSISGTAVEGRVLTEIHGVWNYGPVIAYGYRWVRCDRFGGKCTPIAGAIAQTYTLRPADLGHRIRVRETAATVAGAGAAPFTVSAATAVVKALPKLSGLSLSPAAFRAARLGTVVKYRLVSAASVRFTIQRVAVGRRLVTVRGSFTITGRAGNNSFRFIGRVNGRALAPGNYRLVATPSAGGATGIAQTKPFTILR